MGRRAYSDVPYASHMEAAAAVVAILVMLWLVSRSSPSAGAKPSLEDDIETLYIRGDGEAVLAQLETTGLDHFVPKATALGLYKEAIAEVEGTPLLTEPPPDDPTWLLQVNLAEALSELGRFDEAKRLLETPCESALIESGRRCTLAWILSHHGAQQEALGLLEDVDVESLGPYQCEYWLTLAFAFLKASELERCESALREANTCAVRASSQRNVEFLRASLHQARGDTTAALTHFEAAARHRWRWQGGSGLLAWGDLLAQLGRHEAARAAWTQCTTQDPQSLAAVTARERLR